MSTVEHLPARILRDEQQTFSALCGARRLSVDYAFRPVGERNRLGIWDRVKGETPCPACLLADAGRRFPGPPAKESDG